MSKPPNILIPALGGTALALGLAYGFASRDYGADKFASLETRVEQVQATASAASAQAQAEAERAKELELKIAEVQIHKKLLRQTYFEEQNYQSV